MSNVRARFEAGMIDPSLDISSDARLKRVDVSPANVRKLHDAIRDMLAGYPFLGSLASSDSIAYHGVEGVPFPFAATDAVGIYLNAGSQGFFAEPPHFTDGNRVFTIAHEILHQVLESVLWKHAHKTQGFVTVPRHPTLAPDGTLPFDDMSWQRAEDARINDALIRDGVGELTPGHYVNPGINYQMDFGQAYAIQYAKDHPPQPPGGQGQGQQPGQGGQPPGGGQPSQQGQGQGQQPGQGQSDPLADVLEPGQGGDPFSDDEGADTPLDKASAGETLAQGAGDRAVRVNRAKNAARQAGVGSCSVEALVEQAREPGIDWRSYLPGFLARCAGNSAFDFKRPSRPPILRELMGLDSFFAPNRAGHGCELVVWVGDISGSISEDEHRVTLASFAEMLQAVRPREFIALWCDDRIVRADEGLTIDDDFTNYKIPRGGGTSFIPPFEWVRDRGLTPDGLVYLTDFYGTAPQEKPPYPVLWLSTTQLIKPYGGGGEWGEVLHMPVGELVKKGR